MTSDSSSLARAKLRQRIARRYKLLDEPVRFGDVAFTFTRCADPNAVLDEVAAEDDRRERDSGRRLASDQLHLPYWAEVWDSAYGIGNWLARRGGTGVRVQGSDQDTGVRVQGSGGEGAQPSSLNPEPRTLTTPHDPRTLTTPSVLDLGCGMGLAGTVAAAVGDRVLFADLEPPALLFAKLNSWPWRDRVRFRRMNWQRDRLDERFDLILGADILYERGQWEHLEPFWRAHLKPGGRVLLGEPGRQTGDLFQPWIRECGWSLTFHTQELPERRKTIRLFELAL